MDTKQLASELVKVAKELTAKDALDIVDEIFRNYRSEHGYANLEWAMRSLSTDYPKIPKRDFSIALWMKKKDLESQLRAVEEGLHWAKD